jgi:hypothetical protein
MRLHMPFAGSGPIGPAPLRPYARAYAFLDYTPSLRSPVARRMSIPWRSVFPFEAFPANVGVFGIAAFDIVLIESVLLIVVFGLNAFVSIFVLYVAAVDVVIAIVVIVIAFRLDAFVLVFAFYIAAVHIGKGCGGKREYQCECNQKVFHGGLESFMR